MGTHAGAAGDGHGFASQDGLTVEEHWFDHVVVVAAAGAVDMVTAPRLTDAIALAAAKAPAGVIVDLSKVDFLASAGMSVLVAAHAQMAPRARVRGGGRRAGHQPADDIDRPGGQVVLHSRRRPWRLYRLRRMSPVCAGYHHGGERS